MKTSKRCTRCFTEQPLDRYYKNKASRDGFQSYCKVCQQATIRIWRAKNQERIKLNNQQYREAHREERRNYNRAWRKENKDYWRHYQNARLKGDINYRLHNYIGRALRRAISKKGRSILAVLDYPVDQLRSHLESQFQPGMTWENYGKAWHIDHVIPKSWFNLETEYGIDEYELKVCWGLTNLQPLWANANLKKKNRHAGNQIEITYDQFRVLIDIHKRNHLAFTVQSLSSAELMLGEIATRKGLV